MRYLCLAAVMEGFTRGCRKLIRLDGCFLKRLLKGQILVAVDKDGNYQMDPIAWVVVEKKTSKTWSWFIEQLKTDLLIEDGLRWSLISNMQKVCTKLI